MSSVRFSLKRFLSLLKKEWIEILRDKSVLFIGIGLPVLMLFIYGYGVSMDMESIPATVVLEERSAPAVRFATDLSRSRQFVIETLYERPTAESRLSGRTSELTLTIPAGFAEALEKGRGEVQLTVYGVDSNSALIFKNYVTGVLSKILSKLLAEGRITQSASSTGGNLPAVTVISRSWFNDAGNSRWYLVPGLLVVVSAVSASFMGSIVIAREWERGTMTSLMATPASAMEMLMAKWIPYSLISFVGSIFCMVLAFVLFDEPLHGSIGMLLLTALVFIGWDSAMGLFISAKTKSQFLATEAAIIATFMPTLMLSGFIFDLRSVPVWIEFVGRLLPPTYAVESFKIIFLSGGSELKLVLNLLFIALWTAGLLYLAHRALMKRPTVRGKSRPASPELKGTQPSQSAAGSAS